MKGETHLRGSNGIARARAFPSPQLGNEGESNGLGINVKKSLSTVPALARFCCNLSLIKNRRSVTKRTSQSQILEERHCSFIAIPPFTMRDACDKQAEGNLPKEPIRRFAFNDRPAQKSHQQGNDRKHGNCDHERQPRYEMVSIFDP